MTPTDPAPALRRRQLLAVGRIEGEVRHGGNRDRFTATRRGDAPSINVAD